MVMREQSKSICNRSPRSWSDSRVKVIFILVYHSHSFVNRHRYTRDVIDRLFAMLLLLSSHTHTMRRSRSPISFRSFSHWHKTEIDHARKLLILVAPHTDHRDLFELWRKTKQHGHHWAHIDVVDVVSKSKICKRCVSVSGSEMNEK